MKTQQLKSAPNKSERLETRLTAEQKATIERATRLSGRSMSDFVTQAAFTRVFVMPDEIEDKKILGFYALSTISLDPAYCQKRARRNYPDIQTFQLF